MSEHQEVMQALDRLLNEVAKLRADLRLSPDVRVKALAQAGARNRVLTFRDLKNKGWPYSRASTWRLVREGRFLKPFRLDNSPRNLWMEDKVDAFLAEQSLLKTSGSKRPGTGERKRRPSPSA